MENGSQNAREIRSQNAAKPFVTGSETNDRMALHGRAAPGWEKKPPTTKTQLWLDSNTNWTPALIIGQLQPGHHHKIYCVFSIGSLYSSANQWGVKQCREPSGSPLPVL
jgi:hypothetical protein